MATGIRFSIAGAIFVPSSFGPAQAMADGLGAPRCDPAKVLTGHRYLDNFSEPQAHRCFACPVRTA